MYKGRHELPNSRNPLGRCGKFKHPCKEIARRWNEFEEWHECKENTEDAPERNTPCLLRTECKEITTGIVEVGYLTSVWGEYGWTEDYLDDFDESEFEVTITHWKPINKPKGVEE